MATDPRPGLLDARALHIALVVELHAWGQAWLRDCRAVWRDGDGVLYAQKVRAGADRANLAFNGEWEIVPVPAADEHLPAKLWALFRRGHGVTLG